MTQSTLIKELVTNLNQLSKTLTKMADSCEDNTAIDAPSADKQEAKNTKPDKESAAPVVTIEDVRAVLAEKSQSGLTTKVKELLESFGACKLSAVKEADYGKLLEAAKKL